MYSLGLYGYGIAQFGNFLGIISQDTARSAQSFQRADKIKSLSMTGKESNQRESRGGIQVRLQGRNAQSIPLRLATKALTAVPRGPLPCIAAAPEGHVAGPFIPKIATNRTGNAPKFSKVGWSGYWLELSAVGSAMTQSGGARG
jgi:hypothetical protein